MEAGLGSIALCLTVHLEMFSYVSLLGNFLSYLELSLQSDRWDGGAGFYTLICSFASLYH